MYPKRFITASITVNKIWKQSKCPSTDEWLRKMKSLYVYICIHTHRDTQTHTHTHTHTMEYYLAIKKNENLPFAANGWTWRVLLLNEVSERKRQILYDTPYI